MSMKYSKAIIGNRIRDLPARSALPQPTTPLRATLPQILKQLSSIVLDVSEDGRTTVPVSFALAFRTTP
jgi:hypothetical protein